MILCASLDLPSPSFLPPHNRIHYHAVLGQWEEALSLLPVTCGLQHHGSSSYLYPHYPWRILKAIPLPILRANTPPPPPTSPLPGCAATFATRQENRGTGFVAKLLGTGGDDRAKIVRLIKDSMNSVPEPAR